MEAFEEKSIKKTLIDFDKVERMIGKDFLHEILKNIKLILIEQGKAVKRE
jgi:hypothetical protein